jgi:PhnB protein
MNHQRRYPMSGNPIPKGYHTVTPYLVITDVPRVIDFLKAALGGAEIERHADPKGRIMHAEVRIGDSIVMMGEANDVFPPMPVNLYLYVTDTDATYKAAINAGGQTVREPTTEFYGDRCAGVRDPGGNVWWIATHIEDVSREEMERRQRQKQSS